MIYVISDIHGCFDKYKKMLDKINFCNNDTLYILGDVVDRGKDGIKILIDMANRQNIVPLLGNHDYMAFSVLKFAGKKLKPDWWNAMHTDWIADGGSYTEKAFFELSEDKQESVLNYIEEFSIYETVEIGRKKYILAHAGIDNFEKEKRLDDYELYDFIEGRMNYNRIYNDDFYLVSGHTPTGLIDKSYTGKIYIKNNHIAIDCGAVYGNPLGCICLDNMEEFYVN